MYLHHLLKNTNSHVFEYYFSSVKKFDPEEIIDACFLTNIETNKFKLLFDGLNFNSDNYLLLLRGVGSYNNLDNFKIVYDKCKDLLDITKTFIAREEPLGKYLDFRDYSQPYECDILLYSADFNSYHIVEYLLELGEFSLQSIEFAYNYIKSNPYVIRFCRNKHIDNKDLTLSMLEKYIKLK